MNKQEVILGRNWYALHTYVGYENAVCRNLKQRIESLGMEDKIFNVVVPTEKKLQLKVENELRLRKKYTQDMLLLI